MPGGGASAVEEAGDEEGARKGDEPGDAEESAFVGGKPNEAGGDEVEEGDQQPRDGEGAAELFVERPGDLPVSRRRRFRRSRRRA